MPAKEFKCKITAQPIKDGFLNISAKEADNFPKGSETTKITAIFEDEKQPIQLTYNPKHRMLFGLTAWYREHGAQPGDFVKFKVLEPLVKYKLIFEKGKREGTLRKFFPKTVKDVVGPPINFRGIIYGPLNEQGVVFLFSKINEDLNIKIEVIKQSFPDAEGRWFNGKSWQKIKIEFEYKSSDFLSHGHKIEDCDVIVCWEHDWEDCPIEVIELRSVIKDLPEK